MSYRSLKRVLGETSLERKFLTLFGFSLLILIAGSFWWYGKSTEKIVYESSRETARSLVETVILMHHTKVQDPDFIVLLDDLKQGLASREYRWEFIRPVQEGPNAPRDEFEWDVIKQFRRTARPEDGRVPDREFFEELAAHEYRERRDVVNGKREYQFYTPIRITKNGCVVCHASLGSLALADGMPPQEIGDLVSVAKVCLPDDKTQYALNLNNAVLLGTAIMTTFLAISASYLIVRYVIVKPLAHLRDVSDQITRGDLSLRAELHTGDEFERLATAFNRMLRQLATNQEELKHVNDNLNVKVDELAQANMRLYEMNRLKSDFLATMSHELRTPLNAIIGFSDVLESIASLDEKQKRYVRNIQTSGKVLLEMINDILDLAKIESGKMEVRLSDFRIAQVITAQCDMARPLTERKNIDLETEIDPDLPDMFQDQAKVQQILNNLLSNAIKFTPEGGRIIVSAQLGGPNDLLLKVTDTGVGIAEEDQVAIFEKFRQGKTVLGGGNAMTREYSGTGLGLSIVKELCKLLGGEIFLESELGKGSTFTVRLPLARADQPRIDSALPSSVEELGKSRRGDLPRVEAPAATG
ncbi:MAG TPA: ATP-binding protein [Pirellulales bacterium]|jgi:two-component system sensor histidine kinase BarA|nr:ATP-binding protein [Pirellulales bacterium]